MCRRRIKVMIWNSISDSLQKKGFVPSSKDSKTAEFLIKVTEDKKMYICSIIKNVKGTDITADVIVESAEELQRKFLLSGYADVSVMHIIITDRMKMSVCWKKKAFNSGLWMSGHKSLWF